MDDFLSQILSSSSWPDMNATGRSSWAVSSVGQTNGLLDNPMGLYGEDEKSPTITVIPSSQTIESLTSQGLARHGHDNTSILIGGNSNYDKGLFRGETQPQQDASDCASVPLHHDNESNESKLPLQRVTENCLAAKPLALQLDTSSPVTLAHNSPKFLPVVGCSANSSLVMPGSGSVGSDGNESSGFQQSLGDSHSISSISPLWPTSYTGIPSLSPLMGQSKLHTYGLQGEFLESNGNIMGKRYPGDEKLSQLDNLPVVSVNEKEELHGSNLPSFTAVPQIALTKTAGLQPHQQHVPSTTVGCNGTAKPRVRARRGQATDPHSIAERLRREKIAERMKNLQELVPNSNKTDKASMLDEIIDYVKFLQLQVKVLSMSRLGAAGAVVPLITDLQAEGSSSLQLSASVGQGADLSESQDNIAFEQEVVKLMESNVTMAMQFLQNKGVCLMPIALAAAISGTKTSSNSAASEKKNPSTTLVNGGCSLGPGTQPLPSRSDSLTTENTNGGNGSTVKQEEVHNSACNMRELKPQSMLD